MTEIEKYHLKEEYNVIPFFRMDTVDPASTDCLNILGTKYPDPMLPIAGDSTANNK
jgi:hypothetical protein